MKKLHGRQISYEIKKNFSVSKNITAARYPPSSVIDDDPGEIEEFRQRFKGKVAVRVGEVRKVGKV